MVQKHLEIKTYEYLGVEVSVRIDYDKREISLVEQTTKPVGYQVGKGVVKGELVWDKKSYIFCNRGLEYMNGWNNILDAIKNAINNARKELEEYLEQVEQEKFNEMSDVLDIANSMVKLDKKTANKIGKQVANKIKGKLRI